MNSRVGYVQRAVVELEPGVDIGAPGAAITTELCGSWQHDGPCPLAPHQTAAEIHRESAPPATTEHNNARLIALRIVFAARTEDEDLVRTKIARALEQGSGEPSRWRLHDCEPGELGPAEVALAARIAGD